MAHEWEPWVECIGNAARELGYSPRTVLFYEVDADTVYQEAAYLYPGMFSSWQSGRDYWRMKHSMESGGGYIYELIVETDPAIAYLTNRNKLADHITVIAHCMGHAEVFGNHRLFRQTRPDIDAYFRSAAERFREYEGRYGIDRLEATTDLGHALMLHSTDVVERTEPPKPQASASPFADIGGIGQTADDRDEAQTQRMEVWRQERDQSAHGLPCPDLLWWLARYAPLEDWQRDVLSVFRELGMALQRRIRTKVVNEGAACLLEDKILHTLDLPQHMVLDQARATAYVIRPTATALNPYWLGWRLLQHIEGSGGNVRDVVAQETDLSLLRNYVDEEFVSKHRLYEWYAENTYTADGPALDLRVRTRKWETVRDRLVDLHTHERPEVWAERLDRYGNLVLESDGPLDFRDAQQIIDAIALLWRRGVFLKIGREPDAPMLTAE